MLYQYKGHYLPGVSHSRESPEAIENMPIDIRMSAGVAVAPVHARTVESLIFSADGALRKAKDNGRNRVETAG